MSEWQKIETAPKDKPFLAWCPDEEYPLVVLWEEYEQEQKDELGEDGFWYPAESLIASVGEIIEPTHWQPLPEPPTND